MYHNGHTKFFPGLDGIPLPATPNTKGIGVLDTAENYYLSSALSHLVLRASNKAHLRGIITRSMRGGMASPDAHCCRS